MMKIVGLLDPPSATTFHTSPYLVCLDLEHFDIRGWPDLPRTSRDAGEVAELRQAGFVLWLDNPIFVADDWEGRVGWIGSEFEAQARGVGAYPEGLTAVGQAGDRGSVWTSPDVIGTLEAWIDVTARKVCTARLNDPDSGTLVKLLGHTNPNHPSVRAAQWFFYRKDPSTRGRILAWVERLARDRGETGWSPSEQIKKYRTRIKDLQRS